MIDTAWRSHRTRRRVLWLTLVAALVGLLGAADVARGVTITEFTAGISASSRPFGIAAGPDGNLWFAEETRPGVGRITPSGTVTEFTAGITAGASPVGIAAGPDGNLWFTENGIDRIGRITPQGVVTEFSTGITAGASPIGIAAGPDGNLWFTENGIDRIGRITPQGVVTEFSTGITAGADPFGIAAGPDGNLWFTEAGGDRVGRITPQGVVTEFSGVTPGGFPTEIAAGPDGNVWFSEYFGDRIGRITPQGVVTEFSTGITADSGPRGITAGPDGNLWFTEFDGDRVGRITPQGVVTEFSSGITQGAPLGIAAGPDGNLWFTEYGDAVGRITLDPPVLSIADAAPVTEGDSGTNEGDLVVSLSGASSEVVTVDYATADGTATEPGDYAQKGDTLTFEAGETSKTVTVEVNGDTLDESDEQFTVNLSNPAGATLGDASGTVEIEDDDTTAPPGDNTPPTASIVSGPGGITNDRTPTFTFASNEPGSSFECSIDGGPFSSCASPYTAPPLPGGLHTLRVRARDAAGNQGEPASFSFQITLTLEELNAADPPTLGVDVNVAKVGSGEVLVGIPGAAAGVAGARASQKGVTFVPLTQARQIPIGSFLNTRRGTVRLSSARDTAGRIQTGDFGRGLFQVLQSRKRSAKGLTDLVLKGGSFARSRCGSPGRAGSARPAALRRRTVRRLRSNAVGRFRSRGRHSAATVRGTVWETIDRCDGTLTKVRRGRVTVRDFRRRRNVVVRAGKSYLARAQR